MTYAERLGALDLAQGTELVQGNFQPAIAERRDQRLEVVVVHLEGEMNVLASLASLEPDLRLPQSDPRNSREHPDRVAVRPPLHDGQAELVDVEPLRPLQLGDLEHQLGHAGDGRPLCTLTTHAVRSLRTPKQEEAPSWSTALLGF